MPHPLATLLLLLFLALPAVARAQLATLGIDVTGLEPPTGKVEVSLFDSAETFMNKPLLQQTQPADGSTELRFRFAGLAEGDYAVVVVHDENDNDLYDAGFLRFGAEGLGYSNDAGPWLGRPSFEDARIRLEGSDVDIVITVK